MVRKALIILFLLPVAGAAIMMSCGKTEAYICNFDRVYIDRDSVIPFSKPMTITIEVSNKYARNCFAPVANPFITGCYAMQPPCIKWMNDIKWSTLKMSFDRPMVINGDTLHTGENFLTHPLIDGQNKFKRENGCHNITYTQILGEETVKKMVFDTGLYTMKVYCETTDSRVIENTYTTTYVP